MLFVIEKLAYGVKCCAVAKHIRLANVSANADLNLVELTWQCKPGRW